MEAIFFRRSRTVSGPLRTERAAARYASPNRVSSSSRMASSIGPLEASAGTRVYLRAPRHSCHQHLSGEPGPLERTLSPSQGMEIEALVWRILGDLLRTAFAFLCSSLCRRESRSWHDRPFESLVEV